jgi:hypothetical protein
MNIPAVNVRHPTDDAMTPTYLPQTIVHADVVDYSRAWQGDTRLF